MPRVHRAQPAVPLRDLGQVKVALLMQKDPFPILVVLLLGPGPLMVVALLEAVKRVVEVLSITMKSAGRSLFMRRT